MAKLSKESLNKPTKPQLIAFSMNLLEKNESIQHDVKGEVRELKVSKNSRENWFPWLKAPGELLSVRLANMERQF